MAALSKGSGLAVTRDESGASALEFAIILPVLLTLIFGMIEFGFVFQAQLALTHGAREGARMASVGKYDEATVIERAFPLTPAISTSPSPPTLAESGQAIVVTLSHNYDWKVLPFVGTVPLSGTATMRRE